MDALSWKRDLLPLLPKRLAAAIGSIALEHAGTIEEIRIRVNRQVQAIGNGWETFFYSGGECDLPQADLIVSPQECSEILEAISFHSVYALEEELRKGFITLPGGYRVGLCGRSLLSGGHLERLKGCTFFSFRIARQTKGCADPLLQFLLNNGHLRNTLILGPPGCGKTTLLRDIARQVSDGKGGAKPHKVCIADERSEIAGCSGGIPQNDVGVRTDVLDGCPKAEAMELLLRALSPQVIVTDEIGCNADFAALEQASNAGIGLIASAHAGGIMDVRRRPLLRAMHDAGLFERYIVLNRSKGPGTLGGIFDYSLNGIRTQQR